MLKGCKLVIKVFVANPVSVLVQQQIWENMSNVWGILNNYNKYCRVIVGTSWLQITYYFDKFSLIIQIFKNARFPSDITCLSFDKIYILYHCIHFDHSI